MALITFTRFAFTCDDLLVKGTYGGRYTFSVPLEQFLAIDKDVVIHSTQIDFPNTSEQRVEHKLNIILDTALRNLTHRITGKKVIFIDVASDIPLLGSGEFGIVDRNTNVLEIKPVTGCNLNCIYCSVNEGKNNKLYDVLIEPDYLLLVCAQLAKEKSHPVEFNIGPHGEPLLYPFLEELIRGLRTIPNCGAISINTNGTMLSPRASPTELFFQEQLTLLSTYLQ